MTRKGSLRYRIIASAGLVLIGAFEWIIRRLSADRVFYDQRDFPWTARVEAGWRDVRQELDQVLAGPRPVPSFESLSEEQARIVQPEHWRTFILYTYGRRVDESCQRCPKTTALLASIPGMRSAMFSILTPGTRITPHRGPFKGMMRLHLALIVPPTAGERCAIRVGEETRTWEEGKTLVFDDTYEHEAWNETDGVRTVLFVDFLRQLPFPVSVLNRGMVRLIAGSPFIQNIIENLNRIADAGRLPPDAPGVALN